MDIFFRKVNGHLIPLTDMDLQLYNRIPEGKDVKCTITMPRNIKHHRKFFAILNLVFDNMPEPIMDKYHISSVETLLDHLKDDLGVEHISFFHMEQKEFEEFYNKALDLITSKYLPGVSADTLKNEVKI